MTGQQNSTRHILALNCGSSSLKFSVYVWNGSDAEFCCSGEAEEVGHDSSSFWFKRGDRKKEEKLAIPDHRAALRHAREVLQKQGLPLPDAVGHRFVHGGPKVREHCRITPEVRELLRGAALFAPLHVPIALSVLDEVEARLPQVPQVACLDTAFHRNMPDVAQTLALPADVRALGVERYGFHGLSIESIVARLNPVPERLVVAHLGNGCSITAIRNGVSVDTSMGLTPTGGILMGTRCGDLDPGVMLFLLRSGYSDGGKLERIVDHESGLKGISGGTSDMRDLMGLRAQQPNADLAIRMFCYQASKTIGAMAAALGGLDMLVFTGGIGEHAAEIRDAICSGLGFLGKCRMEVVPPGKICRLRAQPAGLPLDAYAAENGRESCLRFRHAGQRGSSEIDGTIERQDDHPERQRVSRS